MHIDLNDDLVAGSVVGAIVVAITAIAFVAWVIMSATTDVPNIVQEILYEQISRL